MSYYLVCVIFSPALCRATRSEASGLLFLFLKKIQPNVQVGNVLADDVGFVEVHTNNPSSYTVAEMILSFLFVHLFLMLRRIVEGDILLPLRPVYLRMFTWRLLGPLVSIVSACCHVCKLTLSTSRGSACVAGMCCRRKRGR